jgi:hypothetical protein
VLGFRLLAIFNEEDQEGGSEEGMCMTISGFKRQTLICLLYGNFVFVCFL